MGETNADIVAKRNKRVRIAIEQRQADLKFLMNTPHGQRYFGAFLDETCGILAGTYNPHAVDPSGNALFEEGRRSVGIDLTLEMQEAAPAEYAAMLYERAKLSNEALLRSRREAVPGRGEASKL